MNAMYLYAVVPTCHSMKLQSCGQFMEILNVHEIRLICYMEVECHGNLPDILEMND